MNALQPLDAPHLPMAEQKLLDYVAAAARVLGLTLDTAQAQRVAVHLGRTAAMAQQLEQAGLGVADEPAEIYCPLPFPSQFDGRPQR